MYGRFLPRSDLGTALTLTCMQTAPLPLEELLAHSSKISGSQPGSQPGCELIAYLPGSSWQWGSPQELH